jgi:hypothetical protein
MGKLRGVLLGAGLAVAVTTACVVTVWWEGSESSVSFTWTVNGQPPATACGPANAATVRMWISQYLPSCSLESSSCGTWDGAWEWNCTTAAGTTGSHLAAVDMYIGWTLLDASGSVLSYTPWQRYPLVPGDNPLGTLPFVAGTPGPNASISSTWTLNAAATSAAACEAANAANVVLVYRPALSATPSEVEFPCASGTGATATVFTSGTAYELRWELRSASGTVITASPGTTTWQTLTPVAGSNPVNVDLAVTVGRLDMTIEWADKVTGPAWGSCTLPPNDVASIGYSLETTTGTVVQSVDIDTAPIPCTTTLAWVGVPFGTYHLQLDGRAATGATTWAGDCVGISITGLTGASFSCQVPMTTP